MKGPGESPIISLTTPSGSTVLVVTEYPKGQKTTPNTAAQAKTWATIGGNGKRFIQNLRGAIPFDLGRSIGGITEAPTIAERRQGNSGAFHTLG